MHPLDKGVIALALCIGCSAVAWVPVHVAADAPQLAAARGMQRIDLAERLAAGKLRTVNRAITTVTGAPGGVHLSEKPDVGLAWIEGSDFDEGTIEIDIRGRDVPQASFVGVAFHRKDDTTYESVYLRPFNFRASDPARHRHAVQYMAPPEFDWPRLREKFPDEFEAPVDASVAPTDWVPLRVVVKNQRIQIYVGAAASPALDVRKLGTLERGMIGLWTGNNSDGDFAHLRVTSTK